MDIAGLTLGKAEGITVLIPVQLLLQHGQGRHAALGPQDTDIGVGVMAHAVYRDELAFGLLQDNPVAPVRHMARGDPDAPAIHRKSSAAGRCLLVADRHHDSRLAGRCRVQRFSRRELAGIGPSGGAGSRVPFVVANDLADDGKNHQRDERDFVP